MRLSEFDYHLPESLIADRPTKKREDSRLLVFDRKKNKIIDKHFFDVVEYLEPGDLLILNNSKVFPARLIGNKKTGGKVEVLLDHQVGKDTWQVIGRGLKIGATIRFGNADLEASVINRVDDLFEIKFNYSGFELWNEIEKVGEIPLPPYILSKRSEALEYNDRERYQTVYAKNRGSSAAPTAGLHFSDELLSCLRQKGIIICELTLHVGLGTFLPVKDDDISKHRMHREFFSIDKSVLSKIDDAKKMKNKIVAVGTTTVRVLESVVSDKFFFEDDGEKISGWTDIFIYPPYSFKIIDCLITNFHLPKSTLLMLVSAFAGKENVMKMYKHAIENQYRFYSYGDATLIL